jgi:very-short-patch-repair endonuclease
MNQERWRIPAEFKVKMHDLAVELRKEHTRSEDMLWQALRRKQLEGRKFRRQNPIGAFVVDFYCPEEQLVVEVDGGIHDTQIEADKLRQEIIESLGIRFVRVHAEEVENNLPALLNKIRSAFRDQPG